MNKMKHLSLWLLGATFALVGLSQQVRAADYVDIDIHVSINATKEVTVDTSYYNFGAININSSSNSVSALVIHNNSTGLTQTYTIIGGTATSDASGTDWNLVTSSDSIGSNTYAMAAVFTDAGRPGNTEALWVQDYMRVDQYITCTVNVFGDGSTNDEGVDVAPGDDRNLYFRIHTPVATDDGGAHTATIRLSVL